MAGRSVINVLVNADTKDFVSGMDKADSKIGSFVSGGVKNLAKLGAAFTAAGAAAGVVFAKAAFDAAEAAGTSNARIEQIAESMDLFGTKVEKVSDRLIGLAEETARLTGVNQNTIKEAQALLLTFGEVAETADVTGGVFDRATQAAIDLSAAGFGGVTDASKQLGKALNDPIKGISALARSGVTFTEQEKELIETLVESGKSLEAQDLILSAIEKQVGGTAEATANASDIIRVAFSQITERIGMALLPAFERLTGFVLDTVVPAIETLVGVFEEDGLGGVLRFVGDKIAEATPQVLGALVSFAETAGEWFLKVGLPFLLEKAGELGQALIDWIAPRVKPALDQLGDWAGDVGRWFLDTGLPFLVEKAKELGQALIDWISPQVGPALSKLWEWVRAVGRWVTDSAYPWLADKASELAGALVEWIATDATDAIAAAGKWLSSLGDWFANDAGPLLEEKASQLADWLWTWLESEETGEATKSAAQSAVEKFGTAFATEFVPGMLRAFKGIYDALVDAVGGLFKQLGKEAASDFIGGFTGEGAGGLGRLGGFAERLNPIGQIGGVLDRIIPFADGGLVKGPTLGLVGEAGPELIVPLDKAGNLGTNVNVTVNAGVGADGVQVGRQIVQVLNEYAAAGGARLSSSLVGS